MQLKSLKPSHWKKGFWNRVIRYSSPFLSDESFLKLKFKHSVGYTLNLDNPQTFNEKLNWLKLNYRKPEFSLMADKYEVKDLVVQRIGKEYVVPCLGVWNSPDDIDFDALTYPCVLKATNDSSGAIICRSRSEINPDKIRRKLAVSIKRNWYSASREYSYKNIKPRIIADKYLDDGTGHELTDYKFWCFNGEPRIMYCTNKGKNIYENFYDMDFHPLFISHGFPRLKPEFERPYAFGEMKQLCKMLCTGGAFLPFVRIDFFYVGGRVYFGEYTFYDWGGMAPIKPVEWDYKLGEMIILPETHDEHCI